MEVGAHLPAAEHGDDALVHGVVGENVDREVEPGARAVAADRRGTDRHAREVIGFVLPQDRFAHPLELVVERQRHQRMIFGDIRRVADAVNRTR